MLKSEKKENALNRRSVLLRSIVDEIKISADHLTHQAAGHDKETMSAF